jgi:hypothetical protein
LDPAKKMDPESEDGGINMKAILEFNLPEDERAFQLASKALNITSALWHYDQFLRNEVKYNYEKYSEAELNTFITVREEFRRNLIDANVDFVLD